MKTKHWHTLLISILIISLYVTYFHNEYMKYSLPIFLVTGVISLFVGFAGMKKHAWLALMLIILGAFSVIIIIAFVLQPQGRPMSKGATAAVKANLSNTRAQADLIYNSVTPKSYESVCQDASIQKMILNREDITKSVKCFSGAESFVIAAQFKKADSPQQTHWCADSTGASRFINATRYQNILNSKTLCSE